MPERPIVSTVTNTAIESEKPRRFRWVFAFAAPAFAALVLGVWFVATSYKAQVQVAGDLKTTQYAPPADPVADVEPISVEPAVANKPLPARQLAPTIVKTIFRPRKAKRQRIETLTAVNRLTTEERYAYDRLMLALSIAGNKLKVVQDTIDRKSDSDQKVINSNK